MELILIILFSIAWAVIGILVMEKMWGVDIGAEENDPVDCIAIAILAIVWPVTLTVLWILRH